jgi:hypothetical protein
VIEHDVNGTHFVSGFEKGVVFAMTASIQNVNNESDEVLRRRLRVINF